MPRTTTDEFVDIPRTCDVPHRRTEKIRNNCIYIRRCWNFWLVLLTLSKLLYELELSSKPLSHRHLRHRLQFSHFCLFIVLFFKSTIYYNSETVNTNTNEIIMMYFAAFQLAGAAVLVFGILGLTDVSSPTKCLPWYSEDVTVIGFSDKQHLQSEQRSLIDRDSWRTCNLSDVSWWSGSVAGVLGIHHDFQKTLYQTHSK